MLTHLRSRTAQIAVAALGIAWGAGASADPGPSGNSSGRSGGHQGPGPAPRYYAPSPMPLASPSSPYSGSQGSGRSYAPGPGGSGTGNSGPSYIQGPSGAPALSVGGPAASSIPASSPSLVTSVSANPTVDLSAPPVITEAMPNPNASTSPADRIVFNVPAVTALGAPEDQTLSAFRGPLPSQVTVTTLNGGVALEPAAPSFVASVRSQEPCDGLRLTPDCRPLGTVPFLSLGVPQPRSGSLPSGQDERLAKELPDWPWQAIGRVNVADSVSRRFCTGTLVGPRLVLTAGQCLFDYRLGRWVKPEHVHFVVGQVRDRFLGHSRAKELIVPPELRIAEGAPPQRRAMRRAHIAYDWALIRLQDALPVKPLPVKKLSGLALMQEAAGHELARAGYGTHRPYMLSVHRGCSARDVAAEPGLMLNECHPLAGDSGSPILLLKAGEAFVIGLSSGATFEWSADTGYVALAGLGASAAAFGDALTKARAASADK
jgi:protease YdgD